METQYKQNIIFENVWRKNDPDVQQQVAAIWKNVAGLNDAKIGERLQQIIFVAKDGQKVIGISTAFKSYIQQLKNYFYAYRCLIVPGSNIPGIDVKLSVLTRDFLESIHQQ